MTDYAVALTENNPFQSLQRPDGTASARAMLRTGKLHTRWPNLNAAVERAREEFALHFGETAAQGCFHSTVQTSPMPNGGVKELLDWELTPVAQLYALLKCNLPDVNLWFVTTGLEKLEAKPVPATVVPTAVKAAPLDLTEMAVAAGMGVQAYTAPDGRVFPFHKGASEDARKMLTLLWQREAARADATTVAAIAAAPASVIPMPSRYETPKRKAHFDSGHGTWEQGEEAVKNMLWSREPPAGVDFHRLFGDAQRKAVVNIGATDSPKWELLIMMSEDISARIGPAVGGWQAPAQL